LRRLPHYLHRQPGGLPALIYADIREEFRVAGTQYGSRLATSEREQANRQRKGGGDSDGSVTLRTAQMLLDSS